jgi:hypothetical protein
MVAVTAIAIVLALALVALGYILVAQTTAAALSRAALRTQIRTNRRQERRIAKVEQTNALLYDKVLDIARVGPLNPAPAQATQHKQPAPTRRFTSPSEAIAEQKRADELQVPRRIVSNMLREAQELHAGADDAPAEIGTAG